MCDELIELSCLDVQVRGEPFGHILDGRIDVADVIRTVFRERFDELGQVFPVIGARLERNRNLRLGHRLLLERDRVLSHRLDLLGREDTLKGRHAFLEPAVSYGRNPFIERNLTGLKIGGAVCPHITL